MNAQMPLHKHVRERLAEIVTVVFSPSCNATQPATINLLSRNVESQRIPIKKKEQCVCVCVLSLCLYVPESVTVIRQWSNPSRHAGQTHYRRHPISNAVNTGSRCGSGITIKQGVTQYHWHPDVVSGQFLPCCGDIGTSRGDFLN